MRNALRIFVLLLALATVGATAALTQAWVHRRAQARTDQPQRTGAYRADQQRALVIVVAVSFASLLAVALTPGSRREDGVLASLGSARNDMQQVEHLARATIVQGEELERERLARQRSEETLHLQQVLLNRSLEEKIRLGRDLHDGLIQSLYATGLALEAARKHLENEPGKASALLERCIGTLNASIQEVRADIATLSPERVRRGNFRAAVQAVLDLLGTERTATFDLRIAEECARLVPPDTQAELLQFVREAVSNALRHGGASEIGIRLETDSDRLCLGVIDNGRGFPAGGPPRGGHGLANLHARASAIGGELRIESTPEAGTRVVLTFPKSPPEAS